MYECWISSVDFICSHVVLEHELALVGQSISSMTNEPILPDLQDRQIQLQIKMDALITSVQLETLTMEGEFDAVTFHSICSLMPTSLGL